MSSPDKSGDEMRRKFREALERKQEAKASGQDSPDDGRGKSHGKQSHPQRQFRRKSG